MIWWRAGSSPGSLCAFVLWYCRARQQRGNATFNVHITEMRFEGVVRVRIRCA